jgi:hypothetical protein
MMLDISRPTESFSRRGGPRLDGSSLGTTLQMLRRPPQQFHAGAQSSNDAISDSIGFVSMA